MADQAEPLADPVRDAYDWQRALEAGINKAWGGNKPYGYSSTIDLVCLVARIFDEAGFAVRNVLIDGRADD